MSKAIEKNKALNLRKRGFSYGEILKTIPVAKSTLSLWLREISLSKKQKQRLTEKKIKSALRGSQKRREQRIILTSEIKNKAAKEVGKISKREFWLMGVALYWAEGHKERDRGSLVRLGNSDPKMIKLFLKWLYERCGIKKKDILFRMYLHETSKNRLVVVKKYWANVTGFSEEYFEKITWKKNKIHSNRKNVEEKYYGLLDVIVRKSTDLNRKIQGWIEGI